MNFVHGFLHSTVMFTVCFSISITKDSSVTTDLIHTAWIHFIHGLNTHHVTIIKVKTQSFPLAGSNINELFMHTKLLENVCY